MDSPWYATILRQVFMTISGQLLFWGFVLTVGTGYWLLEHYADDVPDRVFYFVCTAFLTGILMGIISVLVARSTRNADLDLEKWRMDQSRHLKEVTGNPDMTVTRNGRRLGDDD